MKKRDLEFLYEMGAFRFFPRSWNHFLGAGFANHAEHTFRVAWIALVIARHERVKNTDKILKMALLHDVAESRTEDPNYLSRQYMERKEELALNDIFADTAIEKEMATLAAEYRAKKSIESKIVKDADQLDVDFELAEQETKGNTLRKNWKITRKTATYVGLYTKTAKQIWLAIQRSNPHDWHLNGRNRLNDGDWKKSKKQ